MAQENAKKFLEKVWADETLRDRIGGKAPEEIVEIAAEQGFDVTADDLKNAAESFRKENAASSSAISGTDPVFPLRSTANASKPPWVLRLLKAL